jgi:hypothetical protein
MRLVAYRIRSDVRLEPAPANRAWMDSWPKRHPYHCLPLTAVNSYGWQLLCLRTFEAVWTGGQSKRAIVVKPIGREGRVGYSHFGGGVLTFEPGCLIRTESPMQLFVCGPPNECKHGICPLSAIVETSWLPFTFTMNWRFTAPDTVVRFEEGEAFCHFFPIAPGAIEEVEPEWRDLASDPVLSRNYWELKLSRQIANGLRFKESSVVETSAHAYEHHYHTGTSANGDRLAPRPRVRYKVRPFADKSVERLPESSDRDRSE